MKTDLPLIRTFLPALAVTAVLTSLAPAVHAQTTARQSTAKTEAAAGEGFNATDKKLIKAVAESDETEITAAKLALEKTSDPKVKEYAQMMIKDHTKSTEMLKPIALAAGISEPDLKLKHKMIAAGLDTASGTAFDKAYIKANVNSHQEILDTVRKDMDSTSNPEVKKFAMTVTPIIEHHLTMAKEMNKAGE